jgi:hypothetical protein
MAKRRRPTVRTALDRPNRVNTRGAPGWPKMSRVLPRPGGLGRHRRGVVGLGGR